MKPNFPAKRNRLFWRNLIFATLVTAACSFVIGLKWPAKQPEKPTAMVTSSTPQTSPLVPVHHKIGFNPIGKGTVQHPIVSLGESGRFPGSPKQNALTLPPIWNPDIAKENTSKSIQSVETPPTDGVSSEITAPERPVETFPVPTDYQSKIVKKVKVLGQEKVIALTFDDGPWPKSTLQVLDILKKNNIKATFFWVGEYLKEYPKIAVQVVADGHAIGNHTWHHWYHKMNPSVADNEIDATAELIYKTTGVTTGLFRPPGGLLNNGVADYAKQKKYVTVMWSVDPMDYRPLPAEKLVNYVIRKAQPGSIVLMHDGGGNHAATVQALPQIIAKLQELGYSFVTVPELLAVTDKEQSGKM
jgi:chitin deacetylase